MRARTAVCALLLLGATSVASAGDLAFDVAAGYSQLSQAKSSAKAVFDGSSGGVTFGAGVRYALGDHLYVAAWGRYFSKDGERVFVANSSSTVFPLGHPLSVRIVPIQATLGYRIGKSKLRPYVGIGGGVTSYKEESTVGGLTESTSQSKASGHALAGLEYGEGSLRFAAEVSYSIVPNSLGVGGVSQVYGEDDIGGLAAVGKIVFSLGR